MSGSYIRVPCVILGWVTLSLYKQHIHKTFTNTSESNNKKKAESLSCNSFEKQCRTLSNNSTLATHAARARQRRISCLDLRQTACRHPGQMRPSQLRRLRSRPLDFFSRLGSK